MNPPEETLKPTVLLSDDDPYVVSALSRVFKKEGLSFLSDTSSEKVMQMARKFHPEVIILDVHQAVGGCDLLSMLKSDPSTRDIPVIMFSGEDDQQTRHTCFELGADDYVMKPVEPTFISKIVRMAHSSYRERHPPNP